MGCAAPENSSGSHLLYQNTEHFARFGLGRSGAPALDKLKRSLEHAAA